MKSSAAVPATVIRSYSELTTIDSFRQRYDYLALRSVVGASTFGFDRWINQQFYTSREWRQLRHHVIARDNACDLGVEGYDITYKIIIHHMNPMTVEDIQHDNHILDPEFLISTSLKTHNAIHYGDASLLPQLYVERKPGDTLLW